MAVVLMRLPVKTHLGWLALGFALAWSAPQANAGSASNGADLFDNWCSECHTTREGERAAALPTFSESWDVRPERCRASPIPTPTGMLDGYGALKPWTA